MTGLTCPTCDLVHCPCGFAPTWRAVVLVPHLRARRGCNAGGRYRAGQGRHRRNTSRWAR